MMHLTKEEISEIIFMKCENFQVKEICEKFHIQKGTFYHHTNPEFRERMKAYSRKLYSTIPLEKKRERLAKRREYQRHYHQNRYKNDEEFRNKQLERMKVKALDNSSQGI